MAMTGFSGSDDLLACFAAGNAFSWDDWFREETEEAHFQEVIDMMLNLAVFAYIGAIIVSSALLYGRSHVTNPTLLFVDSLGMNLEMRRSACHPGA